MLVRSYLYPAAIKAGVSTTAKIKIPPKHLYSRIKRPDFG
jgi:hypothetical protein